MILLLFGLVQSFQLLLSQEDELSRMMEHYKMALEDAKDPSTSEISVKLTPIRLDNPDLDFDSDFRVRVAFPGVLADFPDMAGPTTLYSDTFVTAYPELANTCKGYSPLRIFQLLGLSPENNSDGIIEVYVSLNSLFRGCPDPQISDYECERNILLKGKDSGASEIPWYCEAEITDQVSSRVSINKAHFEWMCQRWELSFTNENVYDNRPWTGLGYTYDWSTISNFGLSEFVIPGFTIVEFISKQEFNRYCNY